MTLDIIRNDVLKIQIADRIDSDGEVELIYYDFPEEHGTYLDKAAAEAIVIHLTEIFELGK